MPASLVALLTLSLLGFCAWLNHRQGWWRERPAAEPEPWSALTGQWEQWQQLQQENRQLKIVPLRRPVREVPALTEQTVNLCQAVTQANEALGAKLGSH